VEFAIKLPGRDDLEGKVVWLPIDAKFPKEDYERLVAASEKADLAGVEAASADLEIRIKLEAKNIRDKYLDPPNTTDFGILFLPTEGLYAEMLRRPALVETLQLEYRVNVTGPTTLAALLNSLQMGFRTLAIQRRSSEVWTLLSAIKTEFGKFGDVMEKVQKKLQEASNVIDQAAARTRAIERKLRNVQDLPPAEAAALLDDGASSGIEIEPEGPDLAEAEQQRPLIPP
jgi:DNA recombination protein RmuC